MSALSRIVVLEFCKLCNWVYEVWVTHRTLYDDNPDADDMKGIKCADALSRLSHIIQEYALHQIAKLHDPAIQKDSVNLTIQYVIKFGGWDNKTLSELSNLQSKLGKLSNKIIPARNKSLSHNDLETILNNKLHGKFNKNEDIEYFRTLQEFVNIIHNKVVGGPYPFNDIAINDAKVLVDVVMGKINPVYQKERTV